MDELMCMVRFGYAHVVNNRYDEWKMYAVGGSANPTILSEGNFYVAPNNQNSKQVTFLLCTLYTTGNTLIPPRVPYSYYVSMIMISTATLFEEIMLLSLK